MSDQDDQEHLDEIESMIDNMRAMGNGAHSIIEAIRHSVTTRREPLPPRKTVGEPFLCPRREEVLLPAGVFNVPKHDVWYAEGDFSTCSWCGSVHPDDFMRQALGGAMLEPTDKNYKVYVRPGKFYFQHLDEAQRKAFVDALNEKRLNIGAPGRFYRLPFFIQMVTP